MCASDLRGFVLAQRVWFEGNRREESFVDDVVGELDLVGGDQVAFPELEGPAVERCLISDRAENEAPVWFEVVVFEKLAATFE